MIEVINRDEAVVRGCNAINEAGLVMNWEGGEITPDAFVKLARSFATSLMALQAELIAKNEKR